MRVLWVFQLWERLPLQPGKKPSPWKWREQMRVVRFNINGERLQPQPRKSS